MRKFQTESKDRQLNHLGLVRMPNAETIPMEDIRTFDTISMNQLTPLDTNVTVDKVFEYAHAGLSVKAISGLTGLSTSEVKTHFDKTLRKGRGARALELLDDIKENEGNWVANFKMLDRIDPMEKEVDEEKSPAEQLLAKFIQSINFSDNNDSKQDLKKVLKERLRK